MFSCCGVKVSIRVASIEEDFFVYRDSKIDDFKGNILYFYYVDISN